MYRAFGPGLLIYPRTSKSGSGGKELSSSHLLLSEQESWLGKKGSIELTEKTKIWEHAGGSETRAWGNWGFNTCFLSE